MNAVIHDGFAAALEERRVDQMAILRWMVHVLLAQPARGGYIVVEQSRRSAMGRLACLRRLIRLGRFHGMELLFADLDQCV